MPDLRAKSGFCKAFLVVILICPVVPVSLGADPETVEVQVSDETIGVNQLSRARTCWRSR